jgi:protein involved in polysaccharide export with SLBB domain
MPHRLLIALLVVATVAGAGCRSTETKNSATLTPSDPQFDDALLVLTHPERLFPGYRLLIIVAEKPPTAPSRRRIYTQVQPDGTVALESNRVFIASGKTLSELSQEVRDYYVPKHFKSVEMRSDDYTCFYYVAGEVRGGRFVSQLYGGPITVLKAIASAGGFTAVADKRKVQLTRHDGERSIIDCTECERDPKMDVPIWHGDYIYVPRVSKWPFW